MHKVGFVGCGNVGSASAYACLLKGTGGEMVLVDQNRALAEAQAGDILHATPFAPPAIVRAGDYADLSGAAIVVIAAGVNQKPGESRLDLLRRNAGIFRQIIPQILDHTPQAILLVATNPVDVMTHLAAHIASRYPGRAGGMVIGSGTILDTARLRALLAGHLGVSSHAIHACVLGEHGDSEVLHWSGATVATLPLATFAAQVNAPVTEDIRARIDTGVRHAAARIISGKGATWYGVGAGIARLVQAILDDEQTILTCSCPLPDVEGVKDVTLSLPHVIGAQGIIRTLYPVLDDSERQALQGSARILRNFIEQLQ